MRLLKQRGQSMGEYAVLFAIVLGAVVGLQGYIRSRLRAKVVGVTDGYALMGSSVVLGEGAEAKTVSLAGASTQGGTSSSEAESELALTGVDEGTATSASTSVSNF